MTIISWLADFYSFTRLQVQDDHTEESLMDEDANIALVVESEKGLFRVRAVP